MDRPLTPAHFAAFETCYGDDPNGPALIPVLALMVTLTTFVLVIPGNALSRNVEAKADRYAIALTGDPEGNVGHFAPVGAFDGKRVLVFDPDREWYEPYWVPEDVFYDGVTDSKADSVKSGGYIRIWRAS